MSDDEAATLLGVISKIRERLDALPTFPQCRTRERMEEFKRRRDEPRRYGRQA